MQRFLKHCADRCTRETLRREDFGAMLREDLFSFEFIRKSAFHGSFRGMQYRICRTGDTLTAWVYPEPWNFEYTPDDKKISKTFPFDREGYEAAKNWLEQCWEEKNREKRSM